MGCTEVWRGGGFRWGWLVVEIVRLRDPTRQNARRKSRVTSLKDDTLGGMHGFDDFFVMRGFILLTMREVWQWYELWFFGS
jgi:hypothetical protein